MPSQSRSAASVLLAPRLIGLHVVAIVAVSIAVGLGLWQYEAWDQRREAEATNLAAAPAVPLVDVMTSDDPFPGRSIGQPVTFEGLWVPDATFLVAGREQGGRTGFWAVTPIAVATDGVANRRDPAMLVVRGWAPSKAAVPEPPSGEVAVTGSLQPPEGSGRQDPDPADDVLQELRIADAIQRVDQDLYGAYVVADVVSTDGQATDAQSAGAGLEPVTPESLPEPSTFTALRNLLYAFEWWVFAAFAAFIWWRWCRDEIEAGDSTGQRQPRTEQVPSDT